jgi:hypothetical protein
MMSFVDRCVWRNPTSRQGQSITMTSFIDRCVCLERAHTHTHTGDCAPGGVNSGVGSSTIGI